METYELICYALAPELSPEEAHARVRAVLADAPRPHPGTRLAVLPLAAVRRVQRELTCAGIVCNYRPAASDLHLSLIEPRHSHRCPRCGTACDIPEGRRNYRCPGCRHPILRHGREIPAPSAQAKVPPPSAATGSRAVATLLTVAVLLIGAGTVQPQPIAEQGRNAWNRAVAPLAREFRFLTQAMALARQHSHRIATASAPSLPHTVEVTPPATSEPIDVHTPAPVSPPAASPLLATRTTQPETAASLPRLPQAVRHSRSLTELQSALTAELESTPQPAAAFPEPLPLPAQALPPVPPPVDIPPRRIEAAVAALDDHLAREAPFLRQLYARDLEQLTQLRRLPGMAATARKPAHPAPEQPAAQLETDPAPLPVTPVKPYGFCPIWRQPASRCPA